MFGIILGVVSAAVVVGGFTFFSAISDNKKNNAGNDPSLENQDKVQGMAKIPVAKKEYNYVPYATNVKKKSEERENTMVRK